MKSDGLITILVNGAQGKMGRTTVDAINTSTTLTLVGTADRDNQLLNAINQCRPMVVVDFTTASQGYGNTLTIMEAGAHPVIGTSGFTQPQVDELTQRSQQLKRGGLIVPNFSIGAVLMMQFSQKAAHYFKQAEIIERHHDHKTDAPSGTALRTAEMITAGRSTSWQRAMNEEILPHARGAEHDGIGIHSLRLPGSLAHQEVLFGAQGETPHDQTRQHGSCLFQAWHFTRL